MTLPLHNITAYGIRRTHDAVVRIVDELTEDQMMIGSATSPTIAFHVWHVARWADLLQARIPGMTTELRRHLGEGEQIWEIEQLVERCSLAAFDLGGDATGMGMADEVSAALRLPAKDPLLDYARRAFEAANRAVEAADEEQLREDCEDLYGRQTSVGGAVLSHLAHVNRHLGMIEALRGVRGLHGTATV